MSVSKFVSDWKKCVELCKEDPDQKVHAFGYFGQTMPVKRVREEMMNKLHLKISQHDPRNVAYWQSKASYEEMARKRGFYRSDDYPVFVFKKYINEQYLVEFYRDLDRLKQIRNRIRVYQFETKYFKETFGHLLSDRSDY